jgi:S1-C subfamily serine protease
VSYDRIKDADAIKIQLSDNFTVDAVVQDYDKELNLAMLAVPLENIPVTYMGNLQVAELGESYTLAVGSPILALGSPNGHTGSMEAGMISGRNSYAYITDNKLDLFNTDITDNPNSDGVIVNMKGEVIGLITRTLKGEQNEGLSTAVGISKIRLILGNMVNNIARNYVGVKTLDMPEAAKKEYKVENGIYVNEVIEDSPAFDSGIQNGDIILQIDDNTVINTNSFFNFISAYVPEDEVLIKILRTTGSTQREMDIKLTLSVKEN